MLKVHLKFCLYNYSIYLFIYDLIAVSHYSGSWVRYACFNLYFSFPILPVVHKYWCNLILSWWRSKICVNQLRELSRCLFFSLFFLSLGRRGGRRQEREGGKWRSFFALTLKSLHLSSPESFGLSVIESKLEE